MYGILKLSQCNAEARALSCACIPTLLTYKIGLSISLGADVLMKVAGLKKISGRLEKRHCTLSGSDDVKLILGGVDNHGTNLTSVEIIPGT